MSGKKRYRLLMIDDDAGLGGLLVEYFERFGHQLTTATTAAEGRHLLRRDPPDLLILDVMLPDADGMELCRAIRSDSDIPILMLTARGTCPTESWVWSSAPTTTCPSRSSPVSLSPGWRP